MARTSEQQPERGERSLDSVLRSNSPPEIVVLNFVEDEAKPKDSADPKKDLWLSTADGRHQSPIVPVRVGPHAETFHVHRDILTRSEYFRKALDGEFKEADNQAIDLPEEDPAIFGFLVAWLYEGKYEPIKPASSVLVAELDKGKGREINDDVIASSGEGTESDNSASDDSVRSRRRRETRRRRQERAWSAQQRKQPGRHRPNCECTACTVDAIGPPCWNCGVTRRPPPPRTRGGWYNGIPPPAQPVVVTRNGYPRPPPPRGHRNRRRGSQNDNLQVDEVVSEERMSQEDLHTWSLAYSLSVDVYVCANRYVMTDFKNAISAFVINNFEIAGLDAAQPSVLTSCKTLHHGLSSMDPLLKKVFARVGFLQARLWKKFPDETAAFFMENPELATLIMKEMIERREEDLKDDLPALPAMEGPVSTSATSQQDDVIIQGPRRRYNGPVHLY